MFDRIVFALALAASPDSPLPNALAPTDEAQPLADGPAMGGPYEPLYDPADEPRLDRWRLTPDEDAERLYAPKERQLNRLVIPFAG